MIFEKRKLQTETLGEYLGEIRTDLNLSVEEVAEKAGFKPKFLEDLESGNFSKLPPDVYVLGFLKQIAKIYTIEAKDLIEQYKKERAIQLQTQVRKQQERNWNKKVFSRLVITPKSVSIAAGAIFVIVTLGYIVWQVSSINRTPSLEIIEPSNRQIVKGSAVNVKGRTDTGTIVTVNDQNVFVDSQGNFQSQLGISAGPKELVITAKNKFDKAVTKSVTIVGEEAAVAETGQLNMKLDFSDTVTLTYVLDDSTSQTIVFHSGDVKQLSAKSRILLSTSNAGATQVALNSQNLGVMGRVGEKLERIPFFAESATINPGQ